MTTFCLGSVGLVNHNFVPVSALAKINASDSTVCFVHWLFSNWSQHPDKRNQFYVPLFTYQISPNFSFKDIFL